MREFMVCIQAKGSFPNEQFDKVIIGLVYKDIVLIIYKIVIGVNGMLTYLTNLQVKWKLLLAHGLFKNRG